MKMVNENNKWVTFLIVLCLLIGIGMPVVAQTVLKLGNILPENNFLTQNARFLAQKVAEKTNGRVKIEVYPASQLGGERDQTEGIQIGTQEMAMISTGVLSAFAPEVGVFGLPFIFRSWPHLGKVLTSSTAERMKEDVLKRSGIRVLEWMEQGFRIMLTIDKPVKSISDLKGMKLRVPEDKVLVRTFQLLGASPTVIPWNEVYTALQTHVVDGMEATPPAILDMKFYEVTNYVAVTNHQHSVVALLISDSVYKRLPERDRKALVEAAQEMRQANFNQAEQAAADALNKLQKSARQATDPDLSQFQKAVEPLYNEFGQKGSAAYIKEIMQIQ